MTIEALQKQLEEVEAKINRRHEQQHRHLDATTPNNGEFGGIRSRSQKRKDQMFDRWSREATENIKLYNLRDSLKSTIKREQERPAKEAAQWKYDLKVLAWWDSLKPGDTYQPGNSPLVITKKNAKSIVTGNTKWSITEVTLLKAKRIAELRAATA